MKYVGTILFVIISTVGLYFGGIPSCDSTEIYTAEPGTLLLLAAVAAAAAGTVVQVQAARQQSKTQAALLKFNAQVEEQKAEQLEQAGDIAAGEVRKATRIRIAQAQAKRAASGVLSTGSPLLNEIDIAEAGALDAATVDFNTQIGVSSLTSRAGALRSQASSTRRAGRLAVGGALFSGASQIGQIGLQANAAGL